MNAARAEVLDRIRRALADQPRPAPVTRDYRAASPEVADLDRFVDRLVDYRAQVRRCAPDAVADELSTLLAGRSVVVPAGFPPDWSDRLDGCLGDQPELSAADLDQIDSVLTTCAVAIAETGTIVLDAGPGQGRRALTLVPDHHVIVVRAEQVVATVPDAIAALNPVRPLTWISGPSATSDIELQRVEGVHGPRRLVIVLVG